MLTKTVIGRTCVGVILVALAAFASCSDDTGNSTDTTSTSSDTFACGTNSACKTTAEYCIISYTNGIETATDCVAMPTACGSNPTCPCVTDDASDHSATCDGGGTFCEIGGANDDYEVEVSCAKNI